MGSNFETESDDSRIRGKMFAKMNKMTSVAEDLVLADNFTEIAELAVSYIGEELNMPAGVWEYEPHTEMLTPVTQNSYSAQIVETQPTFTVENSIAWDKFANGTLDIMNNIQDLEDTYNEDTVFTAEIYVPIGSRGLLCGGRTDNNAITELDAELLKLFQNILLASVKQLDKKETLQVSHDMYKRVFRRDFSHP